MKLTYVVVIEEVPSNFGAYVPDAPVCVATARTLRGIRRRMRSALKFHLECMQKDGDELPLPTMSIDDAKADYDEPIPDDIMESYLAFGDPAPVLSVRFEEIEVEVVAPQLEVV